MADAKQPEEEAVSVSMNVFHDPSGALGPEEVLEADRFSPKVDDDVLPLLGGAYWFKATICNPARYPQERIIYENEDIYDEAAFFELGEDGKVLQRYEAGLGVNPADRLIHNYRPAYPLTIEAAACKTVLLKTVSELSYLWPFVKSPHAFEKDNYTILYFYFFFFGVAFSMILYNLFIFIFHRERIYLYYIFYLVFFSLWMLHQSGYTHYYFSGDDIRNGYIVVIFTFMAFMFFTKALLRNEIRTRLFGWFTNGYIALMFLSALIFVIDNRLGTAIFSGAGSLILPLFAIYLMFHGNRQTKMYLAALVIYLAALSVSMLSLSGFVPYNDVTRHVHPAGAMIEMILFAVILAYRMNLIKREKLDIQQQLLSLQSEQNALLQRKVDAQTKNLTLLFQELHHRVKNNFQLILTFLWVKKKSLTDPKAIEAFEITDKRIHAIAQLHELLYANEATSVRFGTYLHSFLSSFKTEHPDVTIIDEVEDYALTFDTAVTLGLILNELMINSFKYAFAQTPSPYIEITFKTGKIRQCILTFRDNGIGFDAGILATHTGLGYELIKELSRKLNASFELESSNGVSVMIRFECEAIDA